MKAARLIDLKKELKTLENSELLELFYKVIKYKKDNKELLTYLIFESKDEEQYIQELKNAIDQMLDNIDIRYIRETKKGLRKIGRYLDKWLKYSTKKPTDVELRIYLCQKIKMMPFPKRQSIFLNYFYQRQMKKIDKTIATLHEDLQFDYKELLTELNLK